MFSKIFAFHLAYDLHKVLVFRLIPFMNMCEKTFDLYGCISLIRDVGGLGCSFFKVSSTTIESQRTKTEGDLI